MDFKYKISEVAKDFGIPAKKAIDTVAKITGETKKTGGTFEEKELNYLLESLTKENAETSLDAYFAAHSEPKPEPKKPEPKPAAKPAAPAPKVQAQQPAVKQPEAKPAPTQPVQQPAAQTKPVQPAADEKKPQPEQRKRPSEKQAERHKDKRVSMKDLAADTGVKHSGTTETVQVNRAQVQVDTRTVDVNVDKFSARYDDLADSRNMPQKRKNQPSGKKEKFGNKNRQRQQQFGRRRETEAERLQRIQLEKARNAQLKISIPDEITVGELATRLKKTANEVIKKFMMMGEMHAINDVVDFDTAALIAEEFHAKVEHEVHVSIEERLFVQEEDNASDLVERPPVVVVMGHVDHGKTSILDAIRKTNVTAGEAGGITQAIGAYQVQVDGSVITFLDTPGHEAFTAMRARGANMTDIAVLVVAADDGIMPQTIESINHAKAAGVKLIVAINKMDKPTANPERVKEQLTKYEIVPEDWGGETACIPVSAVTGMGINDLLERIVLEAEVMELKANPNRRAKGAVVEARLDKGQGPIATLLIQNGTLHRGDCLIAGTAVGRVRTMRDDKGRSVEEAGPSMPVEITGLTEVPVAGDTFEAVEDERLARELADKRTAENKEKQFAAYTKVTLDNLFDQMAQNDMKELAIVVKADVQGSAEAVKQSLEKLSNDEVRVRVIHAGVGAVSKSDVTLADASNAIIIGFNVRPDAVAKAEAEQAKVEMRMYRVIYDAINDVSDAMKGMLAPKIREVALGEAQVRQVYKISSVGMVAGCRVTSGKITRDAQLRLVRDGIVIVEDSIASLKRFKDDAKEVAEGFECGITLAKFSDIKEGDVFECFKLEEYRD
ncbi:MAG: translation initiation factor IF-2 [Gemmiger sp.]